MDALDRLEPVARPLLRQVDNALATLGAPTDHAVWGLLRRLGTTPADAVTYFADLRPDRLRETAGGLRAQVEAYVAGLIPTSPPWEGGAAEIYTAQARGLEAHLRGTDGATSEGMVGRLRDTASFVDAVAAWQQDGRDRMARTLADVLTSTQAVAVRSHPSLGLGLAEVLRDSAGAAGGSGLARAVLAAAEIGVAVLGVAEDAVATGTDVHRAWASNLIELPYRPVVAAEPLRSHGPIRMDH
jgi:hypothetical protein